MCCRESGSRHPVSYQDETFVGCWPSLFRSGKTNLESATLRKLLIAPADVGVPTWPTWTLLREKKTTNGASENQSIDTQLPNRATCVRLPRTARNWLTAIGSFNPRGRPCPLAILAKPTEIISGDGQEKKKSPFSCLFQKRRDADWIPPLWKKRRIVRGRKRCLNSVRWITPSRWHLCSFFMWPVVCTRSISGTWERRSSGDGVKWNWGFCFGS